MMRKCATLILLIILLLLSINVFAQSDDLQVITFDIDEDFYAEVGLSLDADVVSVLFNVRTSEPEDAVYLVEIYTEDDELIYSLDEEDSEIAFGFEPFTEELTGQLGIFLPAASDYEIVPDDYIFVFEAEISDITSVSAIVRSGDVDVWQSIDINLWVLTDELATDNAQNTFADTIRASMNTTLNPHQLEVGQIDFLVASDSQYDDFSFPYIDDEDDSSLRDVCLEMSRASKPERALNVAIVEGFDEASAEGDTAGIAMNAGNAGVMLDTSSFSCVVVSYEAYGDDFDAQAANILHEAGHFMSLPHTTESDGEFFDIFDDTPECDAQDFDSDDDGFVDDFECDIVGGANNLMFWSGEPEYAPFILSDEQAWVLRRHPLFYASR